MRPKEFAAKQKNARPSLRFCRAVQNRLLQIALSLILGGALGNLYDRLAYGYVVDFLEFYVGKYHWPSFNIADAAISVGVALLAIEIVRNEAPRRT